MSVPAQQTATTIKMWIKKKIQATYSWLAVVVASLHRQNFINSQNGGEWKCKKK